MEEREEEDEETNEEEGLRTEEVKTGLIYIYYLRPRIITGRTRIHLATCLPWDDDEPL